MLTAATVLLYLPTCDIYANEFMHVIIVHMHRRTIFHLHTLSCMVSYNYRDPSQNIPPLNSSHLSYLSSVSQIDGYLLIYGLTDENLSNLRFLRNLELITGLETIEWRRNQFYSLIIEGCQFLETLGLASLRMVVDGGIRISNNPKLCLVDTLSIEELLVHSTLKRTGGLGNNCSGK